MKTINALDLRKHFGQVMDEVRYRREPCLVMKNGRQAIVMLDMGVKPIFKLTAESGRYIKTTGNHPYLTKEGWIKVSELSVGEGIAASVNEHAFYGDGRHRKEQAQKQPLHRLQSEPLSFFASIFYRMNEKSQDEQQDTRYNETDSQSRRKIHKELTRQSHGENRFGNISEIFGDKLTSSFINDAHRFLVSHAFSVLSTLGLKEAYAGQMAVPDIFWDKIIYIDYVGYEHVYDIEVEGTHNFVAGHFVKKQDVAGKLESWDKAGELGSWEAE